MTFYKTMIIESRSPYSFNIWQNAGVSRAFLRDHYPHPVRHCSGVLFDPRERSHYGIRLRERIGELDRLYRLEEKLRFLWQWRKP